MTRSFATTVLALASVVFACGGDDSGGGETGVAQTTSLDESETNGQTTSTTTTGGPTTEGTGETGTTSMTSAPTTGPGGSFPCGDEVECDPATEYCQEEISDIGEPTTYVCIPLPEACGRMPVCECLAGQPCADSNFCELTPQGGLILTCPGG